MKDYNPQKKLEQIEKVIGQGPFSDDWKSLSAYKVPDWYEDLRFGIFIHYGVFTVPAYDTEWYPRLMYVKDSKAYRHHISTYGKHTDFGYKDFIPMFKAECFDAKRWADVFKRSHAQYVVPVAEHHDGFCMYESELSSFNSVDMGPHKDIIGLLKKSVEDAGMIFGTSSHRIEHYFFLGEGRDFDSDIKGTFKRGDLYWPSEKGPADLDAVSGECSPSEEFMQDWLIRTCELIDKYEPKILYFDWWIQREELRPYLKKLLAYYYNKAAEKKDAVVVNYKHDAVPFGIAVPDVERGQLSSQRSYKWQSDTAMCFNSWCHTTDNRYKEAKDVLCDLIDITSKNGTLLLNIGPKEDGTFSVEETAILDTIGNWLDDCGEAIFDSKPYRIFGEGPTEVAEGGFMDGSVKEFTSSDFRFFAGNGSLYAIALRHSPDGKYRIGNFAKKQGSLNTLIKNITCLNDKKNVSFDHKEDCLEITCTYKTDLPVAFRLDM